MKALFLCAILISSFPMSAIATPAAVSERPTMQLKGRRTATRQQFTPPDLGRPVTSSGSDRYRTGGTPTPAPQPFVPPRNDGAPRRTSSAGSR
jgi:hypothetical protein